MERSEIRDPTRSVSGIPAPEQQSRRQNNVAAGSPDFASLHPGYGPCLLRPAPYTLAGSNTSSSSRNASVSGPSGVSRTTAR
jgi:hypothetical protein